MLLVRHRGYAVSQWIRKQVEETFGWMKAVGGFRRTRYRGRGLTPVGDPTSQRELVAGKGKMAAGAGGRYPSELCGRI
jgi:hypothetical protein